MNMKTEDVEVSRASDGSPSVRVSCEIEVVQCLDHPNDTERSIHLRIGESNLGHVFFDDRYDDGKYWILNDHRNRFATIQEAVDLMFQSFGLQCPVGFPYVAQEQ